MGRVVRGAFCVQQAVNKLDDKNLNTQTHTHTYTQWQQCSHAAHTQQMGNANARHWIRGDENDKNTVNSVNSVVILQHDTHFSSFRIAAHARHPNCDRLSRVKVRPRVWGEKRNMRRRLISFAANCSTSAHRCGRGVWQWRHSKWFSSFRLRLSVCGHVEEVNGDFYRCEMCVIAD